MPDSAQANARRRARDCGIRIGVLPTGPRNAIVDVAGVKVGHQTIVHGDSIRTGVSAIIPAEGNLYQQKVPAAIHVANGYGKLAGFTQVRELGVLETPILLTNTLSVAPAIEALVTFTLSQPGNENVKSVNALVGETNDGELNDIRARHVRVEDALKSIDNALANCAAEGCIGAGTGTICFGFKGGIGTASRVLPAPMGGYTVGVLVQSNFGGVLRIDGVPIGELLGHLPFGKDWTADRLLGDVDGSCMLVVATDAPLDSRNLNRLAMRAFMGLARTGGIASNGSGDYVIAFSTAPQLRVAHAPTESVHTASYLHNDFISPLFLAAIEAAEEAIVNSLFAATTTAGVNGAIAQAIPIDEVVALMARHGRIHS